MWRSIANRWGEVREWGASLVDLRREVTALRQEVGVLNSATTVLVEQSLPSRFSAFKWVGTGIWTAVLTALVIVSTILLGQSEDLFAQAGEFRDGAQTAELRAATQAGTASILLASPDVLEPTALVTAVKERLPDTDPGLLEDLQELTSPVAQARLLAESADIDRKVAKIRRDEASESEKLARRGRTLGAVSGTLAAAMLGALLGAFAARMHRV